MVSGAAAYTISILASTISAAETSETIDTSSLQDSGDVRVRVGLMYGDNLTVGFQTTVTDGYRLGIQELSSEQTFTEIWELDTNVVSVTSDANLSKTGMTYLIAEDRYNTHIGGYHVEVHCDTHDREEFEDVMDYKYNEVASLGFDMIPAYIYTGYAIRVGVFNRYEDAEAYVGEIKRVFPGYTVTVAYPTDTAVSVIDPYTDKILFEYDCGGKSELGLKANRDKNGNTYIKTPAGNVYDGVFAFKRYDNGNTDGVSLINILSLESYIAGVLPYETSNDWPMETQKAFAITVRSYTLTQMNKHGAYGFDLCNTTHCQVYKGAGRVNENVMEAVQGTSGQVITYDGNIITAYYSSSMGGVTVSAKDAWGSQTEYPYLAAVDTPWEQYMTHNNGFWITEISPSELCDRLIQAGYTTLKGEIRAVAVREFAKNSTYVKTLGVTDTYGTTVYITNTDKVRTSLTPYVKSANFVIGKGSVEYTEQVVVERETDSDDPSSAPSYASVMTYDKDFGYIDISSYTVMTNDGVRTGEREEELWGGERHSNINVLTDGEEVNYLRRDAFVMSVENAGSYLGDKYNYENYFESIKEQEAEKIENKTEIIPDKSNENILTKIAYAEDEENFIIVGKGWGHGVGMSQYGALDLAEAGYSAEAILHAYFTDINIIHYTSTNDFKTRYPRFE